jgi:aryl-alcohol dehydrogenase-like predicted oxidoreductase
MRYRKLGSSGLVVSCFCLGTMVFGEKTGRGCGHSEARAIIDASLTAGGNFVDTADAYAGGESETIVGDALRDVREHVVVSTKVGLPTGDGPNDAGLTRKHIVSGLEASLRRLKMDYVDILYVHTHDPLAPTGEWLEALARLVDSGKVLYVGVCNQFAWKLAQACTMADLTRLPRIVCAQYQYSPICRAIEHEFMPLFDAFGIALVPWSPLGGGVLSGKYLNNKMAAGRLDTAPSLEDSREHRLTAGYERVLNVICEIANERHATPSQVSLAWNLSKRCVASVAVGARTTEQLRDNIAAAALHLTSSEIARIDTAGSPTRDYPYDFMLKPRPGIRSELAQQMLSAGTAS